MGSSRTHCCADDAYLTDEFECEGSENPESGFFSEPVWTWHNAPDAPFDLQTFSNACTVDATLSYRHIGAVEKSGAGPCLRLEMNISVPVAGELVRAGVILWNQTPTPFNAADRPGQRVSPSVQYWTRRCRHSDLLVVNDNEQPLTVRSGIALRYADGTVFFSFGLEDQARDNCVRCWERYGASGAAWKVLSMDPFEIESTSFDSPLYGWMDQPDIVDIAPVMVFSDAKIITTLPDPVEYGSAAQDHYLAYDIDRICVKKSWDNNCQEQFAGIEELTATFSAELDPDPPEGEAALWDSIELAGQSAVLTISEGHSYDPLTDSSLLAWKRVFLAEFDVGPAGNKCLVTFVPCVGLLLQWELIPSAEALCGNPQCAAIYYSGAGTVPSWDVRTPGAVPSYDPIAIGYYERIPSEPQGGGGFLSVEHPCSGEQGVVSILDCFMTLTRETVAIAGGFAASAAHFYIDITE